MLLGCLSSPICLPQTDLLAGKGLGAAAGFAHVCALCIVGIPFESFSGFWVGHSSWKDLGMWQFSDYFSPKNDKLVYEIVGQQNCVWSQF